jgi:peroxiredoxin
MTTMAIHVGDRIPDATLTGVTSAGSVPMTTKELFEGKKVVLFAVPGAFTPTCSNQHLPGYVSQADAIKAKGVDTIACLAVNDKFVLDAWAKANGALDRILFLSDGNADFSKLIGLEVDLGKFGMGVRSQRYSMVVDNGVVTELNVEQPGKLEVSSADATICQL